MTACAGDDGRCGRPVVAGAPVPLCDRHIAATVDWAAGPEYAGHEYGLTDLLPAPCRACGSRLGVRYPSGWLCAICEWRVGEIVDDGLPPPRIDVVYYLKQGDRVKIGTTANPRQRFAAIWHEEVLAFERGDRRLEQRRHADFAADRVGGEWFRSTPALAAHIAALAGGRDPWDLLARWWSEALALRG